MEFVKETTAPSSKEAKKIGSALKNLLGIGSPQKSAIHIQRTPKRETDNRPLHSSPRTDHYNSARRATTSQHQNRDHWTSRSAPSSPNLPPRVPRHQSQHPPYNQLSSTRNNRKWKKYNTNSTGNGRNHNNNQHASPSSNRRNSNQQLRQNPTNSPQKPSILPKIDVIGPTCSLHVVLKNANGVHKGSKNVKESQLRALFGLYGDVYDITTGRQFHFVNFFTVAGADKAFSELNGTSGQNLLEQCNEEKESSEDTETRTSTLSSSSASSSEEDGDVYIKLQWALPRDCHPLFVKMQDVQERRRGRLQTSQTMQLNQQFNQVNQVNQGMPPRPSSTSPTPRSSSSSSSSLSSSTLFSATATAFVSKNVGRRRTTSSLSDTSKGEENKGKRWADVADEMSDEGGENGENGGENCEDDEDVERGGEPVGNIPVFRAPALAGTENDFKTLMKRRERLSGGHDQLNQEVQMDATSIHQPDQSFNQFLSPWVSAPRGNNEKEINIATYNIEREKPEDEKRQKSRGKIIK